MKILVIGAGAMVEGIFSGLHGQIDLSGYYFHTPTGVRARALSTKIGAQFLENLEDMKDPDQVWLGCKPQQLKELAEKIKGQYSSATFISMLAAIPEARQREILGVNHLVRIMPNLAVQYRKGITLISSESAKGKLPQIQGIFNLLGHAPILEEKELEELTLLTGSGPAFFYEFTKNLAASFTSLDSTQREKLARLVLEGAGISCGKSPLELFEMINNVTSKGGVTIAVLEEWRKNQLKEAIQIGVDAGKKRTSEIKALLS